jgi:hypothetical protein
MAVTTPAMPASTVAVQNSTGQDVDVAITGGTITFVFVNGVQVGTAAGNYNLPQGGSISITYSAAPTWAWTDPLNVTGQPFTATENLGPIDQVHDESLPPHAVGGAAGLGDGVSN